MGIRLSSKLRERQCWRQIGFFSLSLAGEVQIVNKVTQAKQRENNFLRMTYLRKTGLKGVKCKRRSHLEKTQKEDTEP